MKSRLAGALVGGTLLLAGVLALLVQATRGAVFDQEQLIFTAMGVTFVCCGVGMHWFSYD